MKNKINNKIKSKIIRWLSITLAFIVCFLGSTEAINTHAATKLNKTSLTLVTGQSKQLKLIGKSKNVKWSSSKKTVASVTQKGKVTAKSILLEHKGKLDILAKHLYERETITGEEFIKHLDS